MIGISAPPLFRLSRAPSGGGRGGVVGPLQGVGFGAKSNGGATILSRRRGQFAQPSLNASNARGGGLALQLFPHPLDRRLHLRRCLPLGGQGVGLVDLYGAEVHPRRAQHNPLQGQTRKAPGGRQTVTHGLSKIKWRTSRKGRRSATRQRCAEED